MSDNPPWLDQLSDDWVPVPVPGTPTSPVPSRSISHSRQSSLQNSPSRIPVPARRSVAPSPSPIDKKKVSRPCHFVKREPPTPKTPRTPKTPSKLRSPVPDKTKKSPRPNPPSRNLSSRRKQSSTMDTRSPLRSVSNASGQSVQQSTVQIKPKKAKGGEGTPEWRRRLVHGDIPSGEQRDLFAPIGLESVFKPPTPGTEKTQDEALSRMKHSDSVWDFSTSSDRRDNPTSNGPPGDGQHEFGEGAGHSSSPKSPRSPTKSSRQDQGELRSIPGSPRGSHNGMLDVKKGPTKFVLNQGDGHEDSWNGTQMRSASGLEDMRNEDFTPITFSQPNTMDGNAASEVIRSALKKVTNKLERLHLPPYERPDSPASDSFLLNQPSEAPVDPLPEDDLLDVTSHSLPKDLSMGTLDFRGRGAFAHLRRDDYLNEGSFQKLHLSPPPFPSERLSPFLPSNHRIRSSPPFYQKTNPVTDPPTLPRPSSAHVAARPGTGRTDVMPSSGSPLKLFGNHDTFTNNRLLRRMSQFEETYGGFSEDDEPVSPSEEARRKGESRSFMSAQQDALGEASVRRHERPRSRNTPNPRLNRFGDGELDHFDFSDTSPYEPKLLNNEFVGSNQRPPSRRLSVERGYLGRRSYRKQSLDGGSNRSTKNYKSTETLESASSANAPDKQGLWTVEEFHHSETGSRPNSPAKDPHPKRRRTLLQSHGLMPDDAGSGKVTGQAPDNLTLLQRSLMQHGVTEDTERFLRSQSAYPANTPTPSQVRSLSRKRPSSSRNHNRLGHDDHGNQTFSPPDNVIPIVKVNGVNTEIRKGSITTQDFLNEATKIMDIIRSKGRSAGGLSSVEESDAEDQDESGSYEDESTREEFSRPPSREGGDMRKLREPHEPNPRILSHLKKFQEDDDQEFEVNGSDMSLNLDQDDTNSDGANSIWDEGEGNEQHDKADAETRNLDAEQHTRRSSAPTEDGEEDDDLPDLLTINTHFSGKSLSARSIPTGSSSQSSHAKGVLSSDIVSHLIPEQVNGLTYDRYRNQWVKETVQKSPGKPKGEESEDDPFKDIPDLSVDELQEMMRMQSSLSPDKTKGSSVRGEENARQSSPSPRKASHQSERRPQTKEGEPSVNISSVQSKTTPFTSRFSNSETRATSWGSEARRTSKSTSEVEHEIQLHEGRLSKLPRRQQEHRQQARVVTISFSSPLVSQIAFDEDESPTKLRQNQETHQSEHGPACAEADHSSRPLDTLLPEQKSLDPAAIPDLDGRGDLSLVRRGSDGSVASTPDKSNVNNSLVRFQHLGPDTTYSFHLSPLPDFTIDQIDQPLHLEVSYVAQRTQPTSLRQVHGTFALATEDLVKHITEAEPFEPYWENVRRLVLRHKGLITLHKLCDFCPRLEELDVTGNDIGQLGGVPPSLRTLNIQDNCLSNLTAWGHLTNLQYLDVSGNELESLDGFSSLIHLRELKANDNNITNIEGIFDLDGLLSLQLRNNGLTAVDFGRAELTRLHDLDLSHNQLSSIRNIDSLPSLSALDLRFNQLDGLETAASLPSLQSLKLSNNILRTLDVGAFPSLHLLYVDQNFLRSVSGLDKCHSLEVLSAREQMNGDVDGGIFDIDLGLVKDLRKAFLSSNRLSMQSLSPSSPLLSLQLLDIASCSIQGLPVDFASSFPNVVVLNLNFNSLTGLNELSGLKCLARLAAAGNNITRLRRLCQVLSHIGRTSKGRACSLQKVDIRGNPLTVRFYPPAVIGNGKANVKKLKAKEELGQRRHDGLDLPSALAEFGHSGDVTHPATLGEEELPNPAKEIEIDDPYTLPLADPLADQRYLSHLDEPTRLRRRVFELMLYAGTGGSIRLLDGLELRPSVDEGSDMDRAWAKLEKLGVLKKKAITA